MFKDRLRYLRTSCGYSMDDLVDQYNKRFNGKMNKSTLSRYENGLQEPMIYVAKNLAELFDVSVDFLTRDSEEKPTTVSSDGLDPLDKQLMDFVSTLTVDQKEFLLAQLQTMNRKKKENQSSPDR